MGNAIIKKPTLSPNFTVDDIHRLREYNYEMTKDMDDKERMAYYNDRGMAVMAKIEEMKGGISVH